LPTDTATLAIRIQDDPADPTATVGPDRPAGSQAASRPTDPAGTRPPAAPPGGVPSAGVFSNRNSLLWPFLQGLAQVPATGAGQDLIRNLFAPRPDRMSSEFFKNLAGKQAEPAGKQPAPASAPAAPAPEQKRFPADASEPGWYDAYRALQNKRDMGNWGVGGQGTPFKDAKEEAEFQRLLGLFNESLNYFDLPAEKKDAGPTQLASERQAAKEPAGKRIEPPADSPPNRPHHHVIPMPNDGGRRRVSDIGDGPFIPNSRPRGKRGGRRWQMWARLRMFNNRGGKYAPGVQQSAGNSNLGPLNTVAEVRNFTGRLAVATKSINLFSETADAFVARGKELSKFSGDVAGAIARADVRSTLADVREANRIGEPVARLTENQSRIDESVRDLLLPIISGIAAAVLDVTKTILGPILDLVGTVGGFLVDIVALPIAKIIQTVNDAAKAVIQYLDFIPENPFKESEDEKFNKLMNEVLGLGTNVGPPVNNGGVLAGFAQQAVNQHLLGL